MHSKACTEAAAATGAPTDGRSALAVDVGSSGKIRRDHASLIENGHPSIIWGVICLCFRGNDYRLALCVYFCCVARMPLLCASAPALTRYGKFTRYSVA